MRRLGWFLVGAAGATGALVAAPELYGRLRAALGGGDVWNELEPEAEQWGVLREAPPLASEPEPPAEEAAAAEAEPEPAPEPEAEAEAAPEPEAEPEPEPEPEAPAEPDAYETSVWSQPAKVAEPPAEDSAPAEAAPAEDEPDDDTAEIPSTPLTAAPPPEDTAATDLRSRIEASRARLHRKAQAGGAGDDEPATEPDEPGEPDSSA